MNPGSFDNVHFMKCSALCWSMPKSIDPVVLKWTLLVKDRFKWRAFQCYPKVFYGQIGMTNTNWFSRIGCQIGIQCLSSFFIDFNFFYTGNDLFRGSNGILKWSNKWWSSILHVHFRFMYRVWLFSFSFYNYSILYTIKLYFFNQYIIGLMVFWYYQ